jgi:transposase InsO family protein
VSQLCRVLKVSRQGYGKYKESLGKPPKHAALLAKIQAIINEDIYNDKYGRVRLRDALALKGFAVSESTLYRVCKKYGILQEKRKPLGLTKADKSARKSDDLVKRDFTADAPNEKFVSDITQLPTKEGKLYISAAFDCYDNMCVGLSMDDNMRTPLVVKTLKTLKAVIKKENPKSSPIFHTDRGSQYTSDAFRCAVAETGVRQSMNSAGGRCHDNAKCEAQWARFKEEAIYGRVRTENMSMEEVKSLVFRYFMGYWNNRRICHAIGGVPPVVKRTSFYRRLDNGLTA